MISDTVVFQRKGLGMVVDIESGYELHDGTRIPRFGFGTFQIERGAQTKQAVLGALELGYRLIDCARLYGNERSVGEALRESGIARSDIYLTSKVWNDRQLAGPDEVRCSVEESLDALGVEKLDLLLVHWPVRGKYRSTWEQFQQFKQEGLVTSIGVSNFQRAHLDDLLSDGDEVPVVDQMEFHPYLQDEDTFAACREHGIVMEAWSPLGRGLCVKDAAVLQIAERHGVDAGQVILAWELAKGVLPLPRSSKRSRIASNLLALEVELTADEVAAIDALNRNQYLLEGVDPLHFNEKLNGLTSPRD